MNPQPSAASPRLGATLAQKIIARAAGRAHVQVGEYVDCTPDYLVNQELVWPNHKRNLDRLGIRSFVRPDRYIMVVDHTPSAAVGTRHHATHRIVKDVAEQYGVPNFFGPGSGLRHLVMVEQGFARPGELIFSDEGNICTVGVVGALSIPMSTDIVAVLARGQNWIPVPKTVRIELDGRLAFGVSARDFAQTLIRDFTTSGEFMDCCLEFGGPGLASLTLDDRQTILACVYHTGADTGIMEVDELALSYVRERAAGRPYEVLASDPDAEYAMVLRYDLSRIEPMVTVPPEIQGAVPLAQAAGRRVDQATVGSCAGNRLDDLRAAASILRGRRIAKHVTMYISPGSAGVFTQAAREGLLEVFAEAGATVLTPGCNTCWGYQGVLSGREVSITTHQFNYQGRNGSEEAQIFIASPLTVAASAVAGCITDPREFLDGESGRNAAAGRAAAPAQGAGSGAREPAFHVTHRAPPAGAPLNAAAAASVPSAAAAAASVPSAAVAAESIPAAAATAESVPSAAAAAASVPAASVAAAAIPAVAADAAPGAAAAAAVATIETDAAASPTRLRGRVWKFGDEVSGDAGIIDFSAVRDGFGKPFDEELLKSMCFRRLNPDFPAQVRPGDIVVGGTNFAHQNHVEVSAAIKLSGVACVLVESCESAFVRRALSQGLPVLVVPGITQAVQPFDVIEADPATGVVRVADGRTLQARPFSQRMVAIWQAGGLIPALQQQFQPAVAA